MDLVLDTDPQGDVAEAIRSAVVQAGVELTPRGVPQPGVWWRAGLAEAVERTPASSAGEPGYEATRSPRSTLGATRA